MSEQYIKFSFHDKRTIGAIPDLTRTDNGIFCLDSDILDIHDFKFQQAEDVDPKGNHNPDEYLAKIDYMEQFQKLINLNGSIDLRKTDYELIEI